MKTIKQLGDLKSQMQAIVTSMQATLQTFAAESERIRADASRHPDYIKEKVEEARQRAFASFDESLKTLREAAGVAKAEVPFWQHTMLVLSQQRFSTDPAIENLFRLRCLNEFQAMHAALLQITLDNAKAELNWPLLYQCCLAGRDRNGQAGWRGIDLTDVSIPDQAEALETIRTCEALAAGAEHIVAQASATPMLGVEKLAIARRMAPRPIATHVD